MGQLLVKICNVQYCIHCTLLNKVLLTVFPRGIGPKVHYIPDYQYAGSTHCIHYKAETIYPLIHCYRIKQAL